MDAKNGKVAEIISEYDLILNIGLNHNVHIGEKYLIYTEHKVPDPDSDEYLEVIKIPKGRVEVYKVFEKTCFARSIDENKRLTGFGAFGVFLSGLSEMAEKSKEGEENPLAEALMFYKERKPLNVRPTDIKRLESQTIKQGDPVIEIQLVPNSIKKLPSAKQLQLPENKNSDLIIVEEDFDETIISYDDLASLSVTDTIIFSFYVEYHDQDKPASDFSIPYNQDEWEMICKEAVKVNDLTPDKLFELMFTNPYRNKWQKLISQSLDEQKFIAAQQIIEKYITLFF